MDSIWTDTIESRGFPQLNGNVKTDVLIIGGGITGLLCAHMLKQRGVDYMLVEAEKICSGVTKNTTAKLTVQHGLIYNKLIREFGVEKTKMYLKANEKALLRYRELCQNHDCNFENRSSYVYSLDNRKKIEDEIKALEKINYKASFTNNVLLPFKVAGAVCFKNQAQFHPLKFAYAIAQGLNIYENTRVKELIENNIAMTPIGSIKAEKIIVATHFPFINKHGFFFMKMYQHRSYMIALENAQNVEGMYVDENKKGMSFRNYQDYLLIGGSASRTGKKSRGWHGLYNFARLYYPQAKVKYHFATQDCMSLDSIPYIGQYSKNTPNLFVATGYNKWGMTSSMVSAMLLADMVTGRRNEYASVFSPSRTVLRPQLFVNAFESSVNLLTISKKRCPHLGCTLKWNANEHSWDCPCHGSRFNEKGKLIDNPATGDLKNKE